ncbi:MAG: hypothetical protein Q9195_008248 [Heterodermia aff. obscurata]
MPFTVSDIVNNLVGTRSEPFLEWEDRTRKLARLGKMPERYFTDEETCAMDDDAQNFYYTIMKHEGAVASRTNYRSKGYNLTLLPSAPANNQQALEQHLALERDKKRSAARGFQALANDGHAAFNAYNGRAPYNGHAAYNGRAAYNGHAGIEAVPSAIGTVQRSSGQDFNEMRQYALSRERMIESNYFFQSKTNKAPVVKNPHLRPPASMDSPVRESASSTVLCGPVRPACTHKSRQRTGSAGEGPSQQPGPLFVLPPKGKKILNIKDPQEVSPANNNSQKQQFEVGVNITIMDCMRITADDNSVEQQPLENGVDNGASSWIFTSDSKWIRVPIDHWRSEKVDGYLDHHSRNHRPIPQSKQWTGTRIPFSGTPVPFSDKPIRSLPGKAFAAMDAFNGYNGIDPWGPTPADSKPQRTALDSAMVRSNGYRSNNPPMNPSAAAFNPKRSAILSTANTARPYHPWTRNSRNQSLGPFSGSDSAQTRPVTPPQKRFSTPPQNSPSTPPQVPPPTPETRPPTPPRVPPPTPELPVHTSTQPPLDMLLRGFPDHQVPVAPTANLLEDSVPCSPPLRDTYTTPIQRPVPRRHPGNSSTSTYSPTDFFIQSRNSNVGVERGEMSGMALMTGANPSLDSTDTSTSANTANKTSSNTSTANTSTTSTANTSSTNPSSTTNTPSSRNPTIKPSNRIFPSRIPIPISARGRFPRLN